tara:strand:+ start:140 stop:409 length:270 start_codon:yes stop_codon:yes gene_type:complete
MTKFHTVAITALLCSLLWIGGTALLINEYIKVVQIKEFQLSQKENELKRSKRQINNYEQALKDLAWRCQFKYDIIIMNKTYVCYKIDKV